MNGGTCMQFGGANDMEGHMVEVTFILLGWSIAWYIARSGSRTGSPFL